MSLPPAYATVMSSFDKGPTMIIKPSSDYEIRAIEDDGILHITINDRYAGKLALISRCLRNRLFGTFYVRFNNIEYAVNRDKYKLHLNSLGLNDITTNNYNEEVSKVPDKVIRNLVDRVWRNLSSRKSLELTNEYYKAVTRNDYEYAMDRIKQGANFTFYVLKKSSDMGIFLDEPSNDYVIKFYDKAVPHKIFPLLSQFLDDKVVCTKHSPLTLILQKKANGIQEDMRAKLIDMLKEWGSSIIKTDITFELSVYKNIHGFQSTSFRNKSITLTELSFS